MAFKKRFQSLWMLTCCVLGMLLSGCTTLPDFLKSSVPETDDHAVYRILEKNVLKTARKYAGMPYQWGADPDRTNRADCSHLIAAITRNSLSGSGYRLHAHYLNTENIKKNSFPIRKSEVRAGDIVFFKSENGPSSANHAGIVTRREGNNIFFMQASSSRGVIETSTADESWTAYWKNRFDSYRRWKASVFAGI